MDTTETSEVSFAPETAPATMADTAVESDTATESPDAWDWSEYGDRQVKVKVDGDETVVPLREAMESYMRQADYTRKTQGLAAERQRLAQAEAIYQALEADPEGTLRTLQDAFGDPFGQSAPEDEFLDPTEARIAALEAQIAAQQEAARQASIDDEINGLRSRFGDFDESELLNHAIRFGIPNLEAAYAHMTYDSVAAERAAAKQAAEEAALAAKRDAGLVSGGHTAASGVVTSGTGDKVSSVWDAFRLAQRIHNG